MKSLNNIKNELDAMGFITTLHNSHLILSTESGNLDAFQYIDFDYPVDLIEPLHNLAKKAGYEWQCEYTGTYRLYPI